MDDIDTTEEQTTEQTDQQTDQQTEREQIEAAFKGQPTATPAEPEPEPPKYRQITEDEWTALQTRAAEVEALRATLEKSTGTAFGKIGGIERKLTELAAQGSQGIKLSKDKIDRLRSDLPEIAELFDELSVIAAPKEAPQQDLTEVVERAREEARRAAREEALAEQHEDWREVTAAPEFVAFVRAKGPEKVAEITKASAEWNHRVIGRALSEFKAEQAKAAQAEATKDKQRDRIQQAVAPRGTAAPVTKTVSAAEEIMSGFNRSRGR